MTFKIENGDLVEQFKWGKLDVIVHGANCLGGVMGAGIAKTLAEEFPEILEVDKKFPIPTGKERLGNISMLEIKNPLTNKTQFIINGYTQNEIRSSQNKIPFEINALKEVLEKVYNYDFFSKISKKKINIGFPYIGAGLGGGDKKEIENLIKEYAEKHKDNFNTFLIDFSQEKILEFRNEYDFLSNFYPVEIKYKNRIFKSVEMAYMSEKSNDEEWKNKCANATIKDFGKIKKESRNVKLIENWDQVKLKIMADLLKVKFNNPILKEKLLNTKNKTIIEGNYWNDKIWGVCLKTNQGQNLLGRLLMFIRDGLKKENNLENNLKSDFKKNLKP